MKLTKQILVIVIACMFALSLATGCEGSYKDKNEKKVKKAEIDKKAAMEKAKKEKAEKEKAAKIAKVATGDVVCWGGEDPKAAKVLFEAAGGKFEITNGWRLAALGAGPKAELSVGMISDIKNNIQLNKKNLDLFFGEFKKAKVGFVLLTGDTSETYADLKALFDYVAGKGLPVGVIMGNREKKEDFDKAAGETSGKFKNFVNMNRVRVADLGALTIITLAGYHDPDYIHNPPGCLYGPKQIEEVGKLAAAAKSPVLLAAHGPARGSGKTAIDFAHEAGNVGDPQLSKLITDKKIAFAVFGNIHEAGGKANGPDFKTVLEQGKPYERLYLNAGPADSDPWNMNDGSISKGMAAILNVKDGKASYKIIRAK